MYIYDFDMWSWLVKYDMRYFVNSQTYKQTYIQTIASGFKNRRVTLPSLFTGDGWGHTGSARSLLHEACVMPGTWLDEI